MGTRDTQARSKTTFTPPVQSFNKSAANFPSGAECH